MTSDAAVFQTIDTFNDWDRDYYSPRALRYYDRAVADMLRFLNASPGELVLDAGCGPGVHAIRVARQGHPVHAIDLSETVLQEAQRRATDAGVAGQIEFSQADLTKLPFADGTFNRVFSWGVVIHIPDAGRALRELARILKPGGRLALYITNRRAWDYVIEDAVRFVLRRPLPLEHHALGIGRWYSFQNERLWVWRMDVHAVVQQLDPLGLRLTERVAGAATELQRRTGGWTREALLALNNAWYDWHLPPSPCITNLLVFEKTRTH